jgi:hypothetical protein
VFITWDEISGLTAFVDEQEFKQEQYVEVTCDPIGSIVSGKAKSSWSWYLNLNANTLQRSPEIKKKNLVLYLMGYIEKTLLFQWIFYRLLDKA